MVLMCVMLIAAVYCNNRTNTSSWIGMPATPHSLHRTPAWLDLAQSASGFALVVFMWVHMIMVSSILVSKDAMYMVTRMFEGYYFFGTAYPLLVSAAAAGILLLVMLHAALAMRKFPQSANQYSSFLSHKSAMHHTDTTLWWWQVVTGFLLMFLAPVHLVAMILQPEQIGPHVSSWRVFSSHWPFYIMLLVLLEIHGAIGLYRLIVKWNWLPFIAIKYLRLCMWFLIVFLIVHGLMVLAEYYDIGASLTGLPDLRFTPEMGP